MVSTCITIWPITGFPGMPRPDDLSWCDNTVIQGDQVLWHGQITDTYLLALAVHHQGRLVSFDARLSPAAVSGGRQVLCLIPWLPDRG